ncbi:MAG TPA: rhomboid family intramembrane serine protease [Flavisolibacter sp.]|nr:rhomboid family intramembrane serine protease [Flavisolibacter sp.]
MLLPIGDDNRDRRLTPFVNYILILINILVFIFLQDWANNIPFTFSYSTVPAEILTGEDIVTKPLMQQNPITGELEQQPGLGRTGIPVYLTLLSSMFMHGGIAHIGGNMLYLWIFGDNLESDMGHLNYLIFYLLCGIIASLSHVFATYYFNQNPLIPSLGASGAIAGVLGGYLLQHPVRRVHVWFVFLIISIPAIIVVGLWFVFQVINGMGALGGEEAGTIAYAAHIGGFIAGFFLVKLFVRKRRIIVEERKSGW